jgi:D-glycero-D-manno-heptose 1,7-bisphosphate phosphatase
MAQGGRIDAVFFCPHTPEDHCDCRKPLPGMMLDIGRRYGVDLAVVPMVGDTLRDLQAAQAAGCEPHLVLSGRAKGLDEDVAAAHAAAGAAHDGARRPGGLRRHLLRRDHIADSRPGSCS